MQSRARDERDNLVCAILDSPRPYAVCAGIALACGLVSSRPISLAGMAPWIALAMVHAMLAVVRVGKQPNLARGFRRPERRGLRILWWSFMLSTLLLASTGAALRFLGHAHAARIAGFGALACLGVRLGACWRLRKD